MISTHHVGHNSGRIRSPLEYPKEKNNHNDKEKNKKNICSTFPVTPTGLTSLGVRTTSMITAFTGIAFAILTATRIGFHKNIKLRIIGTL
ncbi:hypothetical protein KBD33_05660 [Candidatus Gracilibacteria bacterium]|nr:hypothetical protein [Candidatus Gracilibacteria bacterium]